MVEAATAFPTPASLPERNAVQAIIDAANAVAVAQVHAAAQRNAEVSRRFPEKFIRNLSKSTTQ